MYRHTSISNIVSSLLLLLTTTPTLSHSYPNINPRSDPPAPTVQVRNGSYTGIYSSSYQQDFFLGIPFAQPPVGDLRFRQAQSLNVSWSESRDATTYSPECIGYGSDQWILGNRISEDCLTLNVIRPSASGGSGNGDSGHNAAGLPVAVWIHGGGFYQGGNSDPRYNLSFIVQQSMQADSPSPFIGISINYRLSGWGFLFSREVAEAGVTNIALHDQRLALRWVQENIAAFGGDPARVTIWGESAGGYSVGAHLISYGGRDDGLFQQAISQSGVAAGLASRKLTAEFVQPFYDNVTRAVNCSDAADSLACLRCVPTDVLSGVFNSSVFSAAPLRPFIDNDLIRDSGSNSLRAGSFIKVPYLLGQNHDEGTAFLTRGLNTTDQFLASITALDIDNATALEIANLYPDDPSVGIPGSLQGRPPATKSLGLQYKRAAAFAGDDVMHSPRRLAAKSWAQANVSTYSYVFNVIPNGLPDFIGATHFQEVAFVFYNIAGDGYGNVLNKKPFEGKPESYVKLAGMMSKMWVRFIVNGDPNGGDTSGAAQWPLYTLDDPQNIVFDANVTDLAFTEPDTYRAEGIEYLSHVDHVKVVKAG